jgi:hypothetical protein
VNVGCDVRNCFVLPIYFGFELPLLFQLDCCCGLHLAAERRCKVQQQTKHTASMWDWLGKGKARTPRCKGPWLGHISANRVRALTQVGLCADKRFLPLVTVLVAKVLVTSAQLSLQGRRYVPRQSPLGPHGAYG